MKAVNSVSYVNGQECLITASSDCSVRLWTIQGRYIGMIITLLRRIIEWSCLME